MAQKIGLFRINKTKEVDNDIDLHTSGPDYIIGLIMKRSHYFLILFLTGILLFTSPGIKAAKIATSESQGVKFEKISLSDSLKKAKRENKLVLLDFYAPV